MDAIHKKMGPCVILAGAGTGKTYAIIEKVKHLIEDKIYKLERIVCITFSNEAANEILRRVRKAIDFSDEQEPIVRTFHGFSADLLRRFGKDIGIKEDFSILDPDEAKIVLHRNLKVLPGECHRYISSIGIAKDLGISIDALEEYLNGKLEVYKEIDLKKRAESLQFELQTLYLRGEKEAKRELVKEIKKLRELIDLRKFINVWRAYEKIKVIGNYMDYSDLNKNALRLLKERKEIAENFDYVIVDEFQDTNKVQLDFLERLATHRNITIVGDMNQSIYRFRGAYKENYNEFKKVFGVGKEDIFNLDKSRRSPNKILRAAHKLILNNYSNKEDCFEVVNFDEREGEKIEVYEMSNGREEARKIVEIIEAEIANGRSAESICVLFRTHQQSRVLKRLLEFKRINYCAVSKGSLLKQNSVKTAVDYLNILNKLKKRGRGGEQAWWDLIYQLGFADEDLIKIGKFLKENRECENISAKLLNSLEQVELSDEGRMACKILVERIKMMIPLAEKEISEFVLDVFNISGLLRRGENLKEKEVMLNLNKFHELAKSHRSLYGKDLESFLDYLDVIEALGIEIPAAEIEEKGVRIMTLHATKGLEYEVVIIGNMAQKKFPMVRAGNSGVIPLELYPDLNSSIGDMEGEELDYYVWDYDRRNQEFEERRLCYVAFTRAREKLILTYAREYGGKRFYPSQFLEEAGCTSEDFELNVDNEEKYEEPTFETKAGLKIGSIWGKDNFEEILAGMISGGGVEDVQKSEIIFSPSSLLTFNECQKKYEYKYKYNMPDKKSISWEAMRLGSFLHKVFDFGVRSDFKSVKEFVDYAKELHSDEDWESVELEDALHLIKVFFERHKNKYDSNSKTEQILNTEIAGLKFTGFADRIDFSPDGIEIIDYKTGKSNVPPRERNWQLGYYVLAASKLGKVKRIMLDMLKQEKPLEFELDGQGRARAVNGQMEFNIYEVEQELVKTAHAVLEAWERGFKPCSVEKNCEFCNEYVYGN